MQKRMRDRVERRLLDRLRERALLGGYVLTQLDVHRARRCRRAAAGRRRADMLGQSPPTVRIDQRSTAFAIDADDAKSVRLAADTLTFGPDAMPSTVMRPIT